MLWKFLILFSFLTLVEVFSSSDVEELIVQVQEELDNELQKRIDRGENIKPYKSNKFSRALNYHNTVLDRASKLLANRDQVTEDEAAKTVGKALMGDLATDRAEHQTKLKLSPCPGLFQVPFCNRKSKFREIDGRCNNLANPLWGAANTAFRRLVQANYADGKGEPHGRVALFKSGITSGFFGHQSVHSSSCTNYRQQIKLPNARDVSRFFHDHKNRPDFQKTLMVMQFGQFLDHDVTLTPETEDNTCCNPGKQNGPKCFSIRVLTSDPFYKLHRENCLEFTRSTAFCPQLSHVREQVNGITSFVDASQVYAADPELAKRLREHRGGRLLISRKGKSGDLLPLLKNEEEHRFEYTAGDGRALEMPGLISLHTLFVREHNRIANEIHRIRPYWNDEVIYQEARRIVGAEMQNIVYQGYLPAILGKTLLRHFDLDISTGRTTYDSYHDPSVVNSFATATFRFGHSQIQGVTNIKDVRTNRIQTYKLRDAFFNESVYLGVDGNQHESILNGQVNQPAQKSDRHIDEEVTLHLNIGGGHPLTDLVARNLQRGRDHGLQGYNEYRKVCGLPPACSWFNPPAEIDYLTWRKLSSLYEHPNDIDLFTGGLAEKPVVYDSVLGKTFACLIAKQFKSLLDGDRFFFTHKGQTGSFTDSQLASLRKRTLADVMCDNIKNLRFIKKDVFSMYSSVQSCQFNKNRLHAHQLLISNNRDPMKQEKAQLANAYKLYQAIYTTPRPSFPFINSVHRQRVPTKGLNEEALQKQLESLF